MTKKITEDTIKKIIEEVLNEKQRLEEKKVDLSVVPTHLGDYVKSTNRKGKKGFSQLGWDTSKFDSYTLDKEKIDDLAKLDGTGTDLSPTDVKTGYSTPKQTKRSKQLHINAPDDFKTAVDKLMKVTGPTDAKLSGKLGKAPYNLTNKSTDTQFQAASKKILATITDHATLLAATPLFKTLMAAFYTAHGKANAKYKTEEADYKKLAAKYPAPTGSPVLSSTSVPNIPSTKTIDISNPGLDIDSRPFTSPFGDVSTKGQYDSQSTISNFAGKVQVDSSLYNMFDAVAGDDIGAKFSRLNEVAEILNAGTGSLPTTDDELLLFANDLAILNKIGNLAKEMGSSGAGFELEGILAGLIKGYTPQGSGTSDMLAGKGGTLQMYSAKLVSSQPGQSWMGERTTSSGVATYKQNGIVHHLNKGDVYYIYLVKVGGATAYDVLQVNIIKLKQKKATKKQMNEPPTGKPWSNVEGEYLDETGKFQPLEAGKALGSGDTPKIGKGPTPFLSIKLLDDADSSAFAIGERIQSFVENKGGILKAVMDAARRLQNMDANTKEYRAVRGSGGTGEAKSGTTKSADYVQAIAEDYSKIKSNFEEIFTDTEKISAKVGGKQVFTEQKITSNFLKKLISESFKK
jgi:hypothetical protein